MAYCGIDFSLRTTAGHFTLLKEKISDTAVLERLKACGPWIKAVLAKVLNVNLDEHISGGLRFVVVDASTVQSPGATGTSHRIHLAVDLIRLELLQEVVTDAHVGESLLNFDLKEGDVVVVDRGYNHPSALIELRKRGVDVVLRYNPHSMSLCDEKMEKVNWINVLEESCGQPVCVVANVAKGQEYIDGHVHVIPLPEREAAEARRRARQNAKKRGTTIQAKTLLTAGFVMIFTTLPPTTLNTETIGLLYRVRWQVELFIKRLKSQLDIDRLRAREGGALAYLYLQGKMLYATVVERYIQARFGDYGTCLDRRRTHTPWRLNALTCERIKTWIVDSSRWDSNRVADCLDVMQERTRNRSPQMMTSFVLEILAWARAANLSNA